MSKERISEMVGASKKRLAAEHAKSVESVREDLNSFKKKALSNA